MTDFLFSSNLFLDSPVSETYIDSIEMMNNGFQRRQAISALGKQMQRGLSYRVYFFPKEDRLNKYIPSSSSLKAEIEVKSMNCVCKSKLFILGNFNLQFRLNLN